MPSDDLDTLRAPDASLGDELTLEAFEALDAAVAAIAGEVSLEGILQVIADRLRSLVGARYAALGIVGADRRIARFITSGLDTPAREAIGPPPRGRGHPGTAHHGAAEPAHRRRDG